MSKSSSRRAYLLTAIAVLFAAAIGLPTAKAVNIVANGSFETPTVPVGGFMTFASGSNAITDWTVVGPSFSSVGILLQEPKPTRYLVYSRQFVEGG